MKILFFGDSITDMERNRDTKEPEVFSYGNGYVFLIASELKSRFPNQFEIINSGIAGNRSVDLYARIKSDCWNLKPDVISILIGVNDVWHEIDGQNGVELDRFEKIYETIIKETEEKLPNTKIVLLEPFILHGTTVDYMGYEKFLEVKKYANVIKKLAKKFNLPIILLQEDFEKNAKEYGEKNFLYDGVHPNIAGAKLIADKWLKFFYKFNNSK